MSDKKEFSLTDGQMLMSSTFQGAEDAAALSQTLTGPAVDPFKVNPRDSRRTSEANTHRASTPPTTTRSQSFQLYSGGNLNAFNNIKPTGIVVEATKSKNAKRKQYSGCFDEKQLFQQQMSAPAPPQKVSRAGSTWDGDVDLFKFFSGKSDDPRNKVMTVDASRKRPRQDDTMFRTINAAMPVSMPIPPSGHSVSFPGGLSGIPSVNSSIRVDDMPIADSYRGDEPFPLQDDGVNGIYTGNVSGDMHYNGKEPYYFMIKPANTEQERVVRHMKQMFTFVMYDEQSNDSSDSTPKSPAFQTHSLGSLIWVNYLLAQKRYDNALLHLYDVVKMFRFIGLIEESVESDRSGASKFINNPVLRDMASANKSIGVVTSGDVKHVPEHLAGSDERQRDPQVRAHRLHERHTGPAEHDQAGSRRGAVSTRLGAAVEAVPVAAHPIRPSVPRPWRGHPNPVEHLAVGDRLPFRDDQRSLLPERAKGGLHLHWPDVSDLRHEHRHSQGGHGHHHIRHKRRPELRRGRRRRDRDCARRRLREHDADAQR